MNKLGYHTKIRTKSKDKVKSDWSITLLKECEYGTFVILAMFDPIQHKLGMDLEFPINILFT